MIADKPLTAGPARTRVAGAPPGPRQRERRFGALLDSAAALFVEKGAAATSIDDIVVRAGVAKGTFYHYFQDRAAMLEALRKRYSQHFADSAESAMRACAAGDWQGLLDAWIATLVQEYLASYALHDAIFHDPAVCHRCIISEEPFVRKLAALIDEGRKAGAWDTDDSLATAVCMFHGTHGLLDEAIATGADAAGVTARLSRLFANMLRTR